MSLFPIFLKLTGRPCLVIGAGQLAESKIESLRAADAQVSVIAPDASPMIAELAAAGEIVWQQRAYEPGDVADGTFLVVTATDVPEVNRAVYLEATSKSILCNAVDDPPYCDFYFPSIVRRGDLQIAISTAGQSPALAQRLRREIDAQLPPDMGPWLDQLGQLRREVLQMMPPGPERKALLHSLANRGLCAAEAGKVYLVGAGPGDPDLLTIKAARLLAQAGVVLHDDLVPQSILNLAGKETLTISVGKRCGRKKITQAAIHELMIVSARRGLSVIRLKSGDPMVFGRAAEEMDALREAGIPFEVVPGVTAASSAAAFLEASLTDRRRSSRLIVLSGHHAARTVPEPDLWPGALPPDATLAIYMPGQDLAQVAASLLRSGLPGAMPCVAVTDASRPEATYTASRLSGLAQMSSSSAPTLLLVGHAFDAVLCRSAEPGRLSVDLRSALPASLQA